MSKQNFIFSIMQAFKEAQIIIAAIKLNIFEHLAVPASAAQISQKLSIKERNVELLLASLTAIGLLKKQDAFYCNTQETNSCLNQNSPDYLGEYILFWLDKSNGQDLDKLILGDGQHNANTYYDFKKMACLTAAEIKTGRAAALLQSIEDLWATDATFSVLDLGGGSGMLSIELLCKYINAHALIFDQPSVIEVPESFAKQYSVSARLKTKAGDFLHDELGQSFDLIIASGVIDFAKNDLLPLLEKMAKALQKNGHLYLVTCGFNDDFTQPRSAIVNWLTGRLQGADVLLTQKDIEKALLSTGFVKISEDIVPSVMQNYLGQLYKFKGGSEI